MIKNEEIDYGDCEERVTAIYGKRKRKLFLECKKFVIVKMDV